MEDDTGRAKVADVLNTKTQLFLGKTIYRRVYEGEKRSRISSPQKNLYHQLKA